MTMGVVSELLRCTLVPESIDKGTFTADIWRYCSSALQSNKARKISGLRDFLLLILLSTMPIKGNSKEPASFPAGEMFDLWALVAGQLENKLAVEFCLRLEDSLAALFDETDGLRTWRVYRRVCSLIPQVFINLWMKTVLKSVEVGVDVKSALLPSILEYDCSNFSFLSNLFQNINADAEMANMWECGHLDELASTFVLQTFKQKDANKIIATEHFQEAGIMIGRRFLTVMLSKNNQGSSYKMGPGQILDVLEELSSNRSIPPEMQQSLVEVFNRLEIGSMAFKISHEIQVIKLAISVNSSLQNGESDSTLLLTKAFVRCCKILPKQIKKMLRTKQEAESLMVESLAHICSSLIESTHSLDEKSSHVIDNCIIACLKYGMMESRDFASCAAFGGCLKIVRNLIAKSHSPGSAVVLGSLTPSQIHAMAVSHSSFQNAISSNIHSSKAKPLVRDNGGTNDWSGISQQLELIRLLVCTISLDANHVKVENDTIYTILSVYNASLTATDRLLRRLMFLYDKIGSCKEVVSLTLYS